MSVTNETPCPQLSKKMDFFFFFKRENECSDRKKCILLKHLVIKNILSKTYVLDHSGSFFYALPKNPIVCINISIILNDYYFKTF